MYDNFLLCIEYKLFGYFLLFLQLSLANGRKNFRDNQSNIYYSITDTAPLSYTVFSSLFKVKPTAAPAEGKLCQWNYYCKCIIDFSSLLSLLFTTSRELLVKGNVKNTNQHLSCLHLTVAGLVGI